MADVREDAFMDTNLLEYFCFGILGLYAISAGMAQ
jgi:hypothetical protein